MARSILIPCGGCGYENFPQHRFCGMCGFPLPETPPGGPRPAEAKASVKGDPRIEEFMAPVESPVESVDRAPARPISAASESRELRPASQVFSGRDTVLEREPAAPAEHAPLGTVSGPSFLGLATEPNSDRERASYLLEDEQSSSHRGRFAVLLLLLMVMALGAAVWHWRQEVGGLGARFSGHNPQTSSQPSDGSAAPVSASPSEVLPAAQTDTSTAKPTNPPQEQNPGGQNGQAAAASPSSQAPTATPDATTPAANSAPADGTPASPDPATKDQAAQRGAPSPTDDNSSAEQTMRQEDAAKAARTARRAKLAPVNSTSPAANAGDSSEAEGEKYLYGTGVTQNCDRAQKSLMAAAGRADPKAQSVLGTMYATGHCAPRDLPLAYKWFAKALHQDPNNDRLAQDLKVLWNQMTPDERQMALHN
jgi:hypothetical protein